MANSNSFDNSIPTSWYEYLLNCDFATFEGGPLPQNAVELALPSTSLVPLRPHETLMEMNIQPTGVDDRQQIIIYPTPISLPPPTSPPPPQPVTFDPPKWFKIPQDPYRQKQWDFRPSQPVFFEVDFFPGINVGDALHGRFTDLKGRDDPVLQDARMAISCRFLFPGYPPNKSIQIFTSCNKRGDRVIRSKLAYRVARKLKQYLDAMRSSQVMNPSTDSQWQIGNGFMHVENMFLAKFVPASKGSYQAEIWVMDSTV